MKKYLITLAAIIPLMVSPSLAAEQQAGTISINGTGMVEMTPDLAIISAGVHSRSKTTKQALADNNSKMAALFSTLEEAGIDKKDMQTSNFNIHPEMRYPRKGENKPPMIVGYNVNNQLTVKIRDLAKIGTVLTALVEAGANNMSGLRFDVSNKKSKLEEARKAALADAKAKANLYATELGVKIKRLKSLSESGGYNAPRPMMMKAARMEMAMDAPVPVAEGSLSLSINVNTTWELDN
ncbi:SIMPL domain-containing protein [Cohaesibacter gelatinilyticus]|uniref:SIMPL domain-containing protein n=1 Tax=Cohaesibacter gelatinilyticus TaxID=372072 RepID=A0A285PHR0_9HYPH|nr:SIMPL domain-containing protein [Cohaesibacter gelatinilyticus]SNZ20813.1 hypothetical protein SAMN06265368_3924 [Cohaesibacter gelatinilyticus]